jgi:hypothetical protein
MAVMTTVLTAFSVNGNARTSTISGHTAIQPRLVIEKRRVPENGQTMVESSVKVVYATTDVDGVVLSQKVSFEAVCRYPLLGSSSDIDAALAVFKDIISGDEYANTVDTQEFL